MQKSGRGAGPVLAVDLGGTKILAAIVNPDGVIIARKRTPTLAAEGPSEVIQRIISAAQDILGENALPISRISSVSIAAAGAVRGNTVTASPNLPGWRDIPIGDILSDKLGVKTLVIHDANAAALAEHRFGAGRGVDNFVYITVSTGIGGGIIIGGRLYTGASGSAGEVGHMTIDAAGPPCPCGNTGCLEMLASGKAVAREAIRRLTAGEKSSLSGRVKRLEDIDARIVEAAARAGDPLAREVIGKAADYLAIGMVNIVNILNPSRVVVGGGMSKMGDLLLEPSRRMVRERAFRQASGAVEIVTAELGDEVGILGAALYAWEEER